MVHLAVRLCHLLGVVSSCMLVLALHIGCQKVLVTPLKTLLI